MSNLHSINNTTLNFNWCQILCHCQPILWTYFLFRSISKKPYKDDKVRGDELWHADTVIIYFIFITINKLKCVRLSMLIIMKKYCKVFFEYLMIRNTWHLMVLIIHILFGCYKTHWVIKVISNFHNFILGFWRESNV